MGTVLTIDVLYAILIHINWHHGRGDILNVIWSDLEAGRGVVYTTVDKMAFTIVTRPGGQSVRFRGKQVAVPDVYGLTPPSVIILGFWQHFVVSAGLITLEHWNNIQSGLTQNGLHPAKEPDPNNPFYVYPPMGDTRSWNDREQIIRSVILDVLGVPPELAVPQADLSTHPKMREVLKASIERDIHQARKRNGYY